MKKIIFVVLIVIEICMTILTFLTLDSENSKLLFHGGSIGSTMKVFGPNFLLVLVLYILTILCLFLFRKKIKILLASFLVLFSLWLLCGRTIGIQWTGELIYISTSKINLYNDGNKANNIIGDTAVKNSFPFRVTFINEFIQESIFVGPLIRSDLVNYFNDESDGSN